MKHIWIEGKENSPIFVLLHGTGGDEHSLVSFAKTLDRDASLLALRGEVNENGMLRFFKRKAMGIFDQEDLKARGQAIISFLGEASERYGWQNRPLYLLGFSNGANMGLELLIQASDLFKGAILLSPMFPIKVDPLPDFKHLSLYLSHGSQDPMVSIEDSHYVANLCQTSGGQVYQYWVRGHEVTPDLFQDLQVWWQNQK